MLTLSAEPRAKAWHPAWHPAMGKGGELTYD